MSFALDTQPAEEPAAAAALSRSPGVDRCVLRVEVVTVTRGPSSMLFDSCVASSTATPITSVLVELGLGSGSSLARDNRREIARDIERAGCIWAICVTRSGSSTSMAGSALSDARESALPVRAGPLGVVSSW